MDNEEIRAAEQERYDKLVELGWGSDVEDIFYLFGGNSENIAEVLDYIIGLGKQVSY